MRISNPIGLFLTVFAICVAGAAAQKISGGSPQFPKPTPMPTPRIEAMRRDFPKLPAATSDAEVLLLKEYGAMFSAQGVKLPARIFFKDEADVTDFQRAAGEKKKTVAQVAVTLQGAALDALTRAVSEAEREGLSITPRGADASKRSYQQTEKLWASRVEPGLNHWVAKGRITAQEAAKIRSLSPSEQIPEILRLEKKGIFFAKSLSKSIIFSVAPPGGSQHLSMLALDVAEFDDADVRAILARHGWFQTVVSDLPHFTFLGAPEQKLPSLGLQKVVDSGRNFWVPVTR